MTLIIQWQITAGSILIFCGLVGLAVSLVMVFLQYGRTGSAAVQVLQIRADTLDRELEDAKEANAALRRRNDILTDATHSAELEIKEREKELERLKAMPDTERMLGVFETYQTATLKAFGDLNTTLTPIAEGVRELVTRNQNGRRLDG